MPSACRLYLITPPVIADASAFAMRLAEALSGGDVAALQVRLKGAEEAHLAAVVREILPVARARDVAVIMNDRPDLALRFGCDGVHIGQQDAPYAEARRLLGAERIVGVTCHDSRHLAMQAAEAGADYVAFGAFFPTETKLALTRADPELLEIWQQTMQAPCVAIGGITSGNAAALARAGADFLAVSAGVWAWPEGPAAAVAALNLAIGEGLAARAGTAQASRR
jgi:thiamine-phosphate pyrophosphorylase